MTNKNNAVIVTLIRFAGITSQYAHSLTSEFFFMKKIYSSHNEIIKVSDEDYGRVSIFKWWEGGNRKYLRGYVDGKRIYLSRFIMNPENNEVVDHINGDIYDNRRDNLRVCSQSENTKNRSKNKNNTTGYKGVSLDKRYGKYRAQIAINGKYTGIGYFTTGLEAAKRYDEYAKKYHGQFAKLNF